MVVGLLGSKSLMENNQSYMLSSIFGSYLVHKNPTVFNCWSFRRKDEFLAKNGWKVLRIKWVDMFHEPKKYIKIAKDFIEK